MIEFTVDNKLRLINTDLTETMRKASKVMGQSIRLNFQEGGRPIAWQALKGGGETPLVTTGKLYRTIRTESGPDYALVAAGAGLPYARIHQQGGMTHPKVTEKSKKFYWAMFYQTGDEKWKWMALQRVGKSMNVNIPARPYMVLQAQDIEAMKKLFIGGFFVETSFNTSLIQ